jgi:hypothetical protein
MNKVKIPNQVNFVVDDEDLKKDLIELVTQFNMIKRDKIYKVIFKTGLRAMLNRPTALQLEDFEQ